MFNRMMKPALAGVVALAAALPLVAQAQANWAPTKPVRVIVPFPPGGSNDIVAAWWPMTWRRCSASRW